MCAIFGIIGEDNPQLIRMMSKVQEFRGPDKQNFYFDEENKLNLGNNRLSVIDIDNGHQPMESFNKEFIIVFNGTIFNHKELKSYLSNKGIKFKTNSDTEVFINGYAYWKEEIFNFIDGMWAVAIYDRKKKKSFYQEIIWVKNHYFMKCKKIRFYSQVKFLEFFKIKILTDN